jgi:EAL domain-containing protein (putative c-di-GMP-specific phosphodiesterase class I)
MAVRPPAASTPAAPATGEPVTAESLGWQLRAALPPLRLHSVSLYDREANVLWLSEGALGPDEHSLVYEAIEALTADTSQNCYETGMEDGRVGIFLPVRAPRGDLVGVAMILADLKSVNDNVLEKMVSPQVRTIMQKVAVLLRANAPKANGADAPVPVLDSDASSAVSVSSTVTVKALSSAEEPAAPAPAAAPARAAAPAATAAKASPAPALRTVSAAPAAKVAAKLAAHEARPAAKDAKRAPQEKTGARAEPAQAVRPPAPQAAPDALSPEAIDDILEFELTPDIQPLHTDSVPTLSAPALPASAAAPAGGVESNDDILEWKPTSVAPVSIPVASPAPAQAQIPATVPTLGAAPSASASAGQAAAPHAAAPVVATPAAAVTSSAATGAAPSPASAAAPAAAVVSTTGTHGVASGSNTGTSRTLGGTTSSARILAAGDASGLILEVQPYAKLRAGGRSRRYEILVRTPNRDASRDSAALDAHALQRLFSWLSTNRGAWNLEPTSFTLNLSITTLEDERFPQNVASALKSHGIAPDTIGFEIAEPLCTQRRAQVERFIALCDKVGCFVVIDDFSMDSSVLPLLRSKALRLVKIDPKLTNVAMRDKLAQALVVAIAQAVKVLGIHCSAKRVEAQQSLQWLTAIGCDFAQGPALSQVQPLDALLQAAT